MSMILGAFCVSFLNENDIKGLHDFFENFINIYKTSKIDFAELFQNVYLNNLKYLFIMFIAGFIVVGMPFVIVIFCWKIFYIGFAFGSILKAFGFNGLLIGISNVFLQNFLSVPVFLVFSALSIKFSTGLFLTIRKKNRSYKNNTSFEKSAVSYIIGFISLATLLAVANLIETFLAMIFV